MPAIALTSGFKRQSMSNVGSDVKNLFENKCEKQILEKGNCGAVSKF